MELKGVLNLSLVAFRTPDIGPAMLGRTDNESGAVFERFETFPSVYFLMTSNIRRLTSTWYFVRHVLCATQNASRST